MGEQEQPPRVVRFLAIVGFIVIVASCRTPTGLDGPLFDDMAGRPVAFPTTELSIWATRIGPPGQAPYDIVTVVPPETSFKRGLAPAAIVGRLTGLSNIEGQGGIRPQDLIPNPAFLIGLH